MAEFKPPRQPQIGQPIDIDFFNTYYSAIVDLSKGMPDFWIDASNNNNNNDAADMGNARVRIVAGRFDVDNATGGSLVKKYTINLPKGFLKLSKGTGKKDLFDPIILVTAETRNKDVDEPVALSVQSVDEDSFTVVVREVASKQDAKKLKLDFINYIAIGFV